MQRINWGVLKTFCFLTVTPCHFSKETSIGSLPAEKIAEAHLLYGWHSQRPSQETHWLCQGLLYENCCNALIKLM